VKSNLETIDATTVKMTVEVEPAELKSAIDKAYAELAKQVTIPGFRKGKVPTAILNQRIGFPAVLEQAVNDAMPGLYGQAASENNLRPLGQPEVEITELPTSATEGQLAFTATVPVRPVIELPVLSDITLTVGNAEVSDDDVNTRIDALRERFGSLVGVDRPAKHNDFVVLDLSAKIDGEEVDSVNGISYQIGSGNMLEGLDEALDGLSAGESTTFNTNLVGGERAGEAAEVTVTATGVKELELPELDDEFASMASEFETIAELKDDVRADLAKTKLSTQVMDARVKLMQYFTDNIEVPVPPAAIERAVHEHLERENRLDDAEHRVEATKEATEGIRDQILMDTLAEKLEIKVSQPELVDYMIQMSQQYGMEPQKFIQLVGESGQVPAFLADVARSKAAAHALRQVKVVDEAGNALDLTEIIGSAETDAEQAETEAKLFEQAAAMSAAREAGDELAPSAADPTAIPEM
jgi:trigger factor